MRDNFSKTVAENLAKRVGNHCSNPSCRKCTSGPHTEDDKALNVGVAAHITAASPGGPRYDQSLTSDERKGASNGIWLCQTCGKLVDNDPEGYTKANLLLWKREAEQRSLQEVQAKVAEPVPALHANTRSVSIRDHHGQDEDIDVTQCERHGRPVAPTWLGTNSSRMCSPWLVERLLNNSDLRLYFDPKWCGGIWFVADMRSGDGVVINLDQLADLKPCSPTTTTTPAPQPPMM